VNVLLPHLFTDGAIPGAAEHQNTIRLQYAVSRRYDTSMLTVARLLRATPSNAR
jgi:hypothetical protein